MESEILTPFACLAIARRAGPDLTDGTDCIEEITGKCVAGGDAHFDQQVPTEKLTRSVGNSDDVKRKCVSVQGQEGPPGGDITSGRVALESNRMILCDCNLSQGWLYTTQDGGNAIKRAMNFIRTTASFTRGKQNAADAAICSIIHHAELFLTVPYSMVSATKDRESLICRMLTSKCPGLGDIVDDGAYVNTAICDRGSRSILEAISERIHILIAKRDSIEVYTIKIGCFSML